MISGMAQAISIEPGDIERALREKGIDLRHATCSFPGCHQSAVAPIITADDEDGFACEDHATEEIVIPWVLKYLVPMKIKQSLEAEDDKSWGEKLFDASERISDLAAVMSKTRETLIQQGWSEHMAEQVAAGLVFHQTSNI